VVTQLGVFVIEDPAGRDELPYSQVQAMTLPDIRAMADQFRLVDKDNPSESIQKMVKMATKFPYAILFDLTTRSIVWHGPLPVTANEMRTLLRKYKPAEVRTTSSEVRVVPWRYRPTMRIESYECLSGACAP
jgi:hypothetical protein